MEVTLDYGNGSVEIIPLPFNETLKLKRRYMEHKNYTICVSDRNKISYHPNTCTKLIVQKPVLNISLDCPHVGDIKDGIIVCQLVVYKGTAPPGEVFGLWKFVDGESYKRYLPKLFLGDTEMETHEFNSSYFGTHPIGVIVSNLISFLDLNSNFTFQKPICGISLQTDKNFTTPGKCILLTIDIECGSHLVFSIDFGNQNGIKSLSYQDFESSITNVAQDIVDYDFNETVSLTLGTCNTCYGTTYNEWLGLVHQLRVTMCYPEQGDFVPVVTVSNEISNFTMTLSYPLEIAIPLVNTLTLKVPAFVSKPNGVASVEFTVVPGKEFTGKLTCSWYHELEIFNISNIYVTNSSTEIFLSLDPLPAGYVCGEVVCENVLSSQRLSFCTVMEEGIQNVSLKIQDRTLGIGDEARFLASVQRGTYQGILDFGDDESEEIPLQSNRNFTITHSYGNAGEFISELRLWNNFSYGEAVVNVTVQPIINSVRIGGPLSIDVSVPGVMYVVGTHNLTDVMYHWYVTNDNGSYMANASYKNSHSHEVQCQVVGYLNIAVTARNFISQANSSRRIFCAESLHDVGVQLNGSDLETNVTEKIVKDSTTLLCVTLSTDMSKVIHSWTISGCGNEYNTTLNISSSCLEFPFTDVECFYNVIIDVENPLSKITLNLTLEVMETVSLGPIKLLSPCVPNVMLLMILELYHEATRPCYIIDYGDGSPEMVVGTGCDPNLGKTGNKMVKTGNETVKLGSSNITLGHNYTAVGAYFLTVTGYNDISREQKTIKLPVNAEPCKQIELSILATGHDFERPREEYKSAKFSLVPNVIIDCSSSALVMYSWRIKNLSTGNFLSLDSLDSERFYLDIPGNFLNYGVYRVSVEAFLSGLFGTDDMDEIYIKIIPSPLLVRNRSFLVYFLAIES